ncbi:MAG: chromophore lyase CpcT/CpeT [Myxococcota bacterium]
MRRCWQLVMCWGLAGCPRTPAPMAPPEVPQPRPAAPVVELTDTTLDWLSGHFDSSAQANENEAYFAVSLRSCRVTVEGLPERRTLYVEQALVGQAPYRQRIYVVAPGASESEVLTTIYAPSAPEALVGWCEGRVSPVLSMADLELREGCGVTLRLEDAGLVGATTPGACGSSLRGASSATSEVRLTGDTLWSWDRGWDAEGKQVWGAVEGPYRFDRKH